MNLPGPDTTLPSKPTDMLLKFGCPLCATVLEIPRSRTGQEGPCPVCGATIIAPEVVLPPPGQESSPPALNARVIPSPPSRESFPAEPPKPELDTATVSPHTTRLCDLPPRPAFRPRATNAMEEGDAASAAPGKRRRRHPSHRRASFLRREMWFLLLLLIVIGVTTAFAFYGDQMFEAFRRGPAPLKH